MIEERLTEIEVKIAHQELALDEMNRILTDQQAQLSNLAQLCKSLAERLRAPQPPLNDDEPSDEKPPHY